MPEGDTIFKAARTLNRALAGQPVERFRTVLVHLSRVDQDEPIAGRTIERVESAAKHLLITFSGGVILRTHMRMNGSWHIYRAGERWQLPASAMRIAIETAEWVAVAFNVHEAEFIRASDLARNRRLATLGPDLLAESFDESAALARMQNHANEPIADVLLNQRVLGGIGNIYKSEVLFLAGINPDTRVGTLEDDTLRHVMQIARKLLQENTTDRAGARIVTYRGRRHTTGSLSRHSSPEMIRERRREEGLWVYSRGGLPCRKCGTPIAFRKTGDDARVTYWCPKCQVIRRSCA
jgi:endonuclease VIII